MKQNYFELFSLEEAYSVSLPALSMTRQQLLQQFHPDRFVNATPQEKRLAVQYSAYINDAYEVLIDPVKRAAYLLKLQGLDVDFENNTSMPSEFLIEQMEWHEKLTEAATEQDKQAIQQELKEKFKQLTDKLEEVFQAQDWAKAKELTRQLKFYQKLSN